MDAAETIAQARDALTVKRVFGEPYERNGVTVIPVAKIQGGAGGGGGEGPEAMGGKGGGSGFALMTRPAGVFVIQGDDVSFRPAVDVNRVVLGAQIVAIVGLVVLRSIWKAREKTRRHSA
jgi:uncharacterized spore protein YtfJ